MPCPREAAGPEQWVGLTVGAHVAWVGGPGFPAWGSAAGWGWGGGRKSPEFRNNGKAMKVLGSAAMPLVNGSEVRTGLVEVRDLTSQGVVNQSPAPRTPGALQGRPGSTGVLGRSLRGGSATIKPWQLVLFVCFVLFAKRKHDSIPHLEAHPTEAAPPRPPTE